MVGLARVLARGKEAVGHHAVPVGGKQVSGRVGGVTGRGIDRDRQRRRETLLAPIEILHLHRLIGHRRGGDLQIPSVLIVGLLERRGGLRQRQAGFARLRAAGKEEPRAVLAQRAAERAFVVAVHLVLALLAGGGFERRLLGPRRVREVAANAAREQIAAALGHGVDDAAGEAAVFG
jgi:hypothetical protein